MVWQEGQEEDLDGRKVPCNGTDNAYGPAVKTPNPGDPTAHTPRWTAPIDDGCLARYAGEGGQESAEKEPHSNEQQGTNPHHQLALGHPYS